MLFFLTFVALASPACHQNKTDVKRPADNEIPVVQASSGTVKAEKFLPSNPPVPAEEETNNRNLTSDISAEFLYSGKNAVQAGVSSSTINSQRACIIRGKTLDSSDVPLSGVEISVLNYPEYGTTLSNKKGTFDMVVNGGGHITLCYKKDGYLPVQRMIYAPWQEFSILPDVIMTPVDKNVTNINLSSLKGIVTAQGSEKNDEDGKRQATLLMLSGIQAETVSVF